MKIAQVVAAFPPKHGGTGYVCFHYARELARRGHDVTVFALDFGIPIENDPSDFKVVRLKPRMRYGGGGLIPQLYSKLKGFDIIHLHHPFYGGSEYVYFAALFRKQKYFLTYHMDVYGDTPFKRLLLSIYENIFEKRIINHASLISAPSHNLLKNSKSSKLIPFNKVVEMQHAGVDTETFKPRNKNPELLDKYNLHDKKVALFVGNLLPFKAVDILIKAVAMIDNSNLVLMIVGEGEEKEPCMKLAEEKGISNRVIFAGSQSSEKELPDHYTIADFLVLPSTRSESFGLVILEAMASGIPAIVTDLPGPNTLLENKVDGLLLEPGNPEDLKEKIEYLLNNDAERKKMGDAARKKALDKYSWNKAGEQLEEALKRMV